MGFDPRQRRADDYGVPTMSSNPVTNADRKALAPRYDDPDLERVRDVLGYYGNAAGYSRACSEDLAILIKKARYGKGNDGGHAGTGSMRDSAGERDAVRQTDSRR